MFPHGPVVKPQKQEFKIFCASQEQKRVYQNRSVFEVFSFFPCTQEQPKIIEPLDYEAEVFQRKAQIHNDPHRDLLLCPLDDVSVSTLIRSSRDCPRTSFACGWSCSQGSSLQSHCWPAINPIIMSLLVVKDITYHYTLEWLATTCFSVIFGHVVVFVCASSLGVDRSRRSPGRGGPLFPRCLRMQRRRRGVCLPKRYPHNLAVPCV